MAAPVPLPLRRALWQRLQQGQSPAAIAQALQLAPRTVRHLLHRLRQHGADALAPSYHRSDHPHDPTTQTLYEQTLAWRRDHPNWGAGLLRVLLQRDYPKATVPCERTLQRWLALAGLGPAPTGRRPASSALRADRPHQVWQIDAAEKVRLRCGQQVSWLRIVDECSGAVLLTVVFPHGKWLTVPPTAVQDQLRQAFARWGMPATVRVDNGGPWGSSGDLPPDLALWLLGLGLTVHWNDPHTPQQNGVVERSQGTGKRWAEPGQCDSVEELQQHLQEMDAIQRDVYPSIQGQSRSVAFAGLRHSGRPYSRTWERRHWQQQCVLEHLAGYAVRRRVDKNGNVSLYHRPHYVGCMHQRKDIFVMVDPQRVEWLFVDRQGRQLRNQPAEELQTERIRSLTVTNRE
jgi:hypothetical protein